MTSNAKPSQEQMRRTGDCAQPAGPKSNAAECPGAPLDGFKMFKYTFHAPGNSSFLFGCSELNHYNLSYWALHIIPVVS